MHTRMPAKTVQLERGGGAGACAHREGEQGERANLAVHREHVLALHMRLSSDVNIFSGRGGKAFGTPSAPVGERCRQHMPLPSASKYSRLHHRKGSDLPRRCSTGLLTGKRLCKGGIFGARDASRLNQSALNTSGSHVYVCLYTDTLKCPCESNEN